jgi:hypothetical protein
VTKLAELLIDEAITFYTKMARNGWKSKEIEKNTFNW